MRGRPKKEDGRDRQYRVRLTEAEEQKLNYVCETTGLSRSDIMRHALEDYFSKVELYDENAEDLDHISLKRAIRCPYCQAKNRIDLEDECSVSSYDRQMGEEILYEFDFDTECEECGKGFRVRGSISEYPVGAFNFEEINTIQIWEDD